MSSQQDVWTERNTKQHDSTFSASLAHVWLVCASVMSGSTSVCHTGEPASWTEHHDRDSDQSWSAKCSNIHSTVATNEIPSQTRQPNGREERNMHRLLRFTQHDRTNTELLYVCLHKCDVQAPGTVFIHPELSHGKNI
jgi:hypothetical protein